MGDVVQLPPPPEREVVLPTEDCFTRYVQDWDSPNGPQRVAMDVDFGRVRALDLMRMAGTRAIYEVSVSASRTEALEWVWEWEQAGKPEIDNRSAEPIHKVRELSNSCDECGQEATMITFHYECVGADPTELMACSWECMSEIASKQTAN